MVHSSARRNLRLNAHKCCLKQKKILFSLIEMNRSKSLTTFLYGTINNVAIIL